MKIPSTVIIELEWHRLDAHKIFLGTDIFRDKIFLGTGYENSLCELILFRLLFATFRTIAQHSVNLVPNFNTARF